MMDWLVGVKPAVMKPEMEIHSPWKNARTGSIPATKQNSMSKTVAIPITASEILLDQARGGDDIGDHMLAATFRRIQPRR